MKISIGKMLRVALFSLPLALPAFAQSAGGTGSAGSDTQPMGSGGTQNPSDTDTNRPSTGSQGATGSQGSSGTMDMDQGSTSETSKSKSETTKTKKQHKGSSSDSGSQPY